MLEIKTAGGRPSPKAAAKSFRAAPANAANQRRGFLRPLNLPCYVLI
jgi:hypothetical protein